MNILKGMIISLYIIVSLVLIIPSPLFASETEEDQLHQSFDQLLGKYVVGQRFDYAAIFANKSDLQNLYDYVDRLEKEKPSKMSREAALAYWLNLYNAATLELVLMHYPLKSIKDIGGFFSSPWNKEVVKVEGEEVTLNQIENEIIRPQFEDARIHFALNCASIGCPPLAKDAFIASNLDAQLESVTATALKGKYWVYLEPGKLHLSKIFDWYEQDFIDYSGSVRQFVAAYLPDKKTQILDENNRIRYLDYDWALNKPE